MFGELFGPLVNTGSDFCSKSLIEHRFGLVGWGGDGRELLADLDFFLIVFERT